MQSIDQLPAKNTPQIISVVIESNDDGYLAMIPGIQGAFAEGDTPQEAIFNCIDVLKMIMEYKQEQNENLNLGSIELSANTGWAFTIPVKL
jgi:predicted RNase H-like HicB family nuclease